MVSFDLLQHHDYDVAIRYGTGEWRGFVAEKIAEEEVFPVCSPRLFNQSGPKLRRPEDLRLHTVNPHSSNLRCATNGRCGWNKRTCRT